MLLTAAASVLSLVAQHCGETLMDRERVNNLMWCYGGTGLASAWNPREDRVFTMLACESSFPQYFAAYGGPDVHLYKDFETLEDWSDFAER